MTISNPTGQPTLLLAVVRTDHSRLSGLLAEIAVDTETPGVREDIARQVLEATQAHVDTEARLVRPAVRDALGAAVAREMADDNNRVLRLIDAARQLSADPSAWVDEFRHAVETHCELLDGAILPALARSAPSRMVTLGYQFGRELEAAARRTRYTNDVHPGR